MTRLISRCARFTAAFVLIAVLFSATADPALAAPVPANLVYHLDASDPLDNGGSSLPSDGGALPTWSNVAPTGPLPDAATAPLASTSPLWHLDEGPNNQPAVQFNASLSAYYKAASASGFNFLHNGAAHTVFIVSRSASSNPGVFMVELDSGSGNTGGDIGYSLSYHDQPPRDDTLFVGIANGTDWVVRSDVITGSDGTPDNVVNPGTWELLSTTFDYTAPSPQLRVFVNGEQVGSATNSAQPPSVLDNDAGGLIVGGAYLGNLLYNGYISEVLIYNDLLDESEIQQVNAYLEDRYDLGITNVPEPAAAATVLLVAGGVVVTRRSRRARP